MRRPVLCYLLLVAMLIVSAPSAAFIRDRMYAPLSGNVVYESSYALVVVGEDLPGETAFSATATIWRDLLSQWHFPAENIRIVQARSQSDVVDAFQAMGQVAGSSDRVVVAIISHGQSGEDGPSLVLRQDGNGNIEIDDVIAAFVAVPGKHKWMILDACRSGDVPGLRPPLGMTKDENSLLAKSLAVSVTSAPARDAAVTETGTRFALTLREAWQDVVSEARGEGLFLSDLWRSLEPRLSEAQLGRIGSFSTQMLLDPALVVLPALRLPEIDSDSRQVLRRAIAQLRSREREATDPEAKAWLSIQLASALSFCLDPGRAVEDLEESQSILRSLKNLQGGIDRLRQKELVVSYLRLAEYRDAVENLNNAIDIAGVALASPGCRKDEEAELRLLIGFAKTDLSAHREPRRYLTEAMSEFDQVVNLSTENGWVNQGIRSKNGIGVVGYRLHRVTGDVASLKSAIEAFSSVLQVFTESRDPIAWAIVTRNRAAAYLDLARLEDTVSNLDRAINGCQDAGRVLTETARPRDWAASKNCLGIAYLDLSQIKDPEANIRRAIGEFEAALRVRREEAEPGEWAETKNNLSTAYVALATITEPVKNLQLGIDMIIDAFRVWTEKGNPSQFAMLQYNLGLNHYAMAKFASPEENFRKAISAFESSLRVRTLETFPLDRGFTSFNLGNSYLRLSELTDRTKNLQLALSAFEVSKKAFLHLGNEAFAKRATDKIEQIRREIG